MKSNVEEVSGACHKHFRTREQAEAFIEDWKQTVSDVYYNEIKAALDQGCRPLHMSYNVDCFLQKQKLK